VSLLVASEISKSFSGIEALNDVSLDVNANEIVGLIGPNGAGKTTFFNCLLGLIRPDSGRVMFEGRDLTHVPTYKRARYGIARTFQRIELFTGMTPREHFLVADRARSGKGSLWKDLLFLGRPTRGEEERAQQAIDLLGLGPVADRRVESLSLGTGRLIEIGRALMTQPKLVLLDEPSSGLDRTETAALADTLREVQRDAGIAILLVEHDVDLVRNLVERVFVLDFGELIASGTTQEVFSDAAVRQAYLGDIV
jgi:branched-chain amino acid transport system ATP-binding protein